MIKGPVYWKGLDQHVGEAKIKILMDGRGRYPDNIFIERLWRFLKQEAAHLNELLDDFQAKRVIKDWIGFYNTERLRSAFEKQTPEMHTLAQCTSTRRHKI